MSFIASGVGLDYIPLAEVSHPGKNSPGRGYVQAVRYRFEAGKDYTADGMAVRIHVCAVDRARRCPRCTVLFLGKKYRAEIRLAQCAEILSFTDVRGLCYVVRAGGRG